MAELPQTTAEDLLKAAEAAHILGPAVSTDDVGDFLGGSRPRAEKALTGARELELVVAGTAPDNWTGTPIARVLAQATQAQKTILLRYQLENYQPYCLFRNRILAGETPENAARQVCLAHGLTVDEHEAERALKDFGTYSRGLGYGEDQRLLASVDSELLDKVLEIHSIVLDERAAVQAHVLDLLGPDAAGFVTGESLDKLVDGYFDLVRGGATDQSIFQLGKGLETFLKDLAQRAPALTVPASTRTMGQYAHFLKQEGRLKEKQFQVAMGVIGIRNAADHSGDAEIGNSPWTITKETAHAAHHITWSLIRSWFATDAGDHRL